MTPEEICNLKKLIATKEYALGRAKLLIEARQKELTELKQQLGE